MVCVSVTSSHFQMVCVSSIFNQNDIIVSKAQTIFHRNFPIVIKMVVSLIFEWFVSMQLTDSKTQKLTAAKAHI